MAPAANRQQISPLTDKGKIGFVWPGKHLMGSWVALCYHLVMSQPVKLSDALVLDARLVGELVERSIAGQVEFWARLGRSIEPLLQGDQALALCRSSAARPLSECLDSVDSTKGRQRLKTYLESQPFPHYEAHPEQAGLLIRMDEDGRRTTGRFVNRQFQAVKSKKRVVAK
jgi:ParD-like antitoxin of type II bacterial toxin-antitoxin system